MCERNLKLAHQLKLHVSLVVTALFFGTTHTYTHTIALLVLISMLKQMSNICLKPFR